MYRIVNGILLFPYYTILKLRNSLYDKNFIKSETYDIPVISVGNITVGGTGKTPHVEFLVRLLKERYRIAVISRGYKRKSKGFRIISADDNYREAGDEPLQIKRKFSDIIVAVDKSRRRAIEKLQELPEGERPEMIILDDAFQHRKVTPAISILLIDYNRPINKDYLLPFGKLRDLPSSKKRADIIIITKAPQAIDLQQELTSWRIKLKLKEEQKLLFSTINYSEIQPVFEECDTRYTYSGKSILFSGIANDKPLKDYLFSTGKKIVAEKKYGDHHNYTGSDIRELDKIARKNPTAILITTEKDSQRLIHHPAITQELKKRLFYLPITVNIIVDTAQYLEITPQEVEEMGNKSMIEAIRKS